MCCLPGGLCFTLFMEQLHRPFRSLFAALRSACAACRVASALHFLWSSSTVLFEAFSPLTCMLPFAFVRSSFMNAIDALLLAALSLKVRFTISLHLTAALREYSWIAALHTLLASFIPIMTCHL